MWITINLLAFRRLDDERIVVDTYTHKNTHTHYKKNNNQPKPGAELSQLNWRRMKQRTSARMCNCYSFTFYKCEKAGNPKYYYDEKQYKNF